MNGKSLTILAALVVLLGVFIGLYERKQPTTDEAERREEKIFPDLEETRIASVDLSNSHGEFLFERRAGGWRLTSPIDAEADGSVIDGVLRTVVALRKERVLDSDEIDPAEYGLDDPPARVVLSLSDGSTKTLVIGRSTPLDSRRAVTTGSGSVILTDGGLFSSIDRNLDAWRSHRIVDFRLDALSALSVRKGDTTIEAVRLGDSWRLRSPVDDRADREQLRNVVGGLSSLRVVEFVDDPASAASMGLDQPETVVRLIPSNGDPARVLEFGVQRQGSTGAKEIACRRDGADLFWVNDAAETPLGKAAVLWRDPRVLDFDTWDVETLKLGDGSTTLELEKHDGVWRFTDGNEARDDEVRNRLQALSDLRAVAFDLVDLGRPEIGSVELTVSDTEAPIVCTFSEPLQEGGDVLVKVSDRDTVMSVDPEALDSIIGDLDTLRAETAVPENENSTETKG